MYQIKIIRNRGFLNEVQILTIRNSICSGEKLDENNVGEGQQVRREVKDVVDEILPNQYNVEIPEIKGHVTEEQKHMKK